MLNLSQYSSNIRKIYLLCICIKSHKKTVRRQVQNCFKFLKLQNFNLAIIIQKFNFACVFCGEYWMNIFIQEQGLSRLFSDRVELRV